VRRDLRDDCELDATTLRSLPTHPDVADTASGIDKTAS
jgi:hypothetical protein